MTIEYYEADEVALRPVWGTLNRPFKELVVILSKSKSGYLTAYVEQIAADGPVRGRNLMQGPPRRQVTKIESAKEHCISMLGRFTDRIVFMTPVQLVVRQTVAGQSQHIQNGDTHPSPGLTA